MIHFFTIIIVLAVSIDIIIERRLTDIGRAVGPTDNPTNLSIEVFNSNLQVQLAHRAWLDGGHQVHYLSGQGGVGLEPLLVRMTMVI